MPTDEARDRPELTPDDMRAIRNSIVQRIMEEMRVGPLPALRSGYVQSEGKNYGSYTRE